MEDFNRIEFIDILQTKVMEHVIESTFLISEVSICHMEVMFMPCVYTVYVRICLKRFHVFLNERR